MKKVVSMLVVFVFILVSFSCVSPRHDTRQARYRGAGRGGLIGAVAGAILDKRNRWRGGLVGLLAGLLVEATLAEISQKANREAVASGKPVEYASDDGRRIYQAEPVDYVAGRKCNLVRGRVWENGKMVDEKEEYVCK